MNNQLRAALAASLLGAGAAHAQPVAAPAAAASEPANTLPVIVVTGEKTKRAIDKTSASVGVMDAKTLDEWPSIKSLNNVLENMANVTSTGTQNLAPAIRGVDGTGPAQGSDAFLAGTRPRLTTQIDGRTISYNETTFGDFGLWDVEQVEVYRGAQSLLQGRNAIGGAVVMKTNDPSFTREFGARLVFAEREQAQYAAVVSGPLIDHQVAFRLAADYAASKSTVDGYQAYPGVDFPGQFRNGNVRGKLLVTPTALPGFRSLLTLAHSEYEGPQTESVALPDENQTSYPSMPVFAPRSTSLTADTSWPISDTLRFESLVSAADLTVRRKALPGDGNALIEGYDAAVEPRLRYASPDQKLNAFGGVYLFKADQDESIDLAGGGTFDDTTTNTALYGEATYALTPTLDLTVGARYEREKRQRSGGGLSVFGGYEIDLDKTYSAFLPKLALAWQADPTTTVGASLIRGYNAGGAGVSFYEIGDFDFFQPYTFEPESVWTLEGFARGNYLDGTLRLSGNLFYSDYKDMQLPFNLSNQPGVWAYVVKNADRVATYGAELSAAWLPVRNLTLSAELGLLKTDVRRYPDSGLEGHALARAPKLTTNLGANYRFAHGFELGADARYSTGYYSDVTNIARAFVKPGWTLNTNAGWRFDHGRVFAYVANLTDNDRYLLHEADPNDAAGEFDTVQKPRPRTVGIGLELWY